MKVMVLIGGRDKGESIQSSFPHQKCWLSYLQRSREELKTESKGPRISQLRKVEVHDCDTEVDGRGSCENINLNSNPIFKSEYIAS